jgi:hypothetical protein
MQAAISAAKIVKQASSTSFIPSRAVFVSQHARDPWHVTDHDAIAVAGMLRFVQSRRADGVCILNVRRW